MGFEPTDGGFADLSLRPLGYRAEANKYSESFVCLSVARAGGQSTYGPRTSTPRRSEGAKASSADFNFTASEGFAA